MEDDEIEWVGSAFLYGRNVKGDCFHSFLVTNRHVLEDLSNAWIRCNYIAGQPAKDYPLQYKDGQLAWHPHPDPDVDVAVVPMNFEAMKNHELRVEVFTDRRGATVNQMNKLGVSEGDFVYALGFPMDLVTRKRNAVIVRSGAVARIQDLFAGSRTFLIDAPIFPGNSGGPVVLRPEVARVAGTGVIDAPLLIGIASAYVPYHETAISAQTGEARVVFTENSGLTEVVPVDRINEAIDHAKLIIEKDRGGKDPASS